MPPRDWFAVADTFHCEFAGIVKSIEAVAVNYQWDLAQSTSKLYSAQRIEIDDRPSMKCAQSALYGVRAGDSFDSLMRSVEPSDRCTRIDVGVPAGWDMPINKGDTICGGLMRYSGGYQTGTEMVVYNEHATLLLAFADPLPRYAWPLAHWSFQLGGAYDCFGTEVGPRCRASVTAIHYGQRATFKDDLHPQRLKSYDVMAFGYRNGQLPVWLEWMKDSGYGFAIARRRP